MKEGQKKVYACFFYGLVSCSKRCCCPQEQPMLLFHLWSTSKKQHPNQQMPARSKFFSSFSLNIIRDPQSCFILSTVAFQKRKRGKPKRKWKWETDWNSLQEYTFYVLQKRKSLEQYDETQWNGVFLGESFLTAVHEGTAGVSQVDEKLVFD